MDTDKHLQVREAEPTLTDLDSSCPGSLLKATPPPSGYPWVSGVGYVTPDPRNRGLVLDHQLLKEPEPKKRSKRVKFDQKQHLLVGFFSSSSSKP